MMYNDDKTWKQHYDDWKKIIPTIKFNEKGDVTKTQFEYRTRLLERLVKEFESK